jgi:hypothetical protein
MRVQTPLVDVADVQDSGYINTLLNFLQHPVV